MLTEGQNKALYPVLQHYTGSQITSISSDDDNLTFNTYWGQRGKLLKGLDGNWNIIIDDEVVEVIEKEVFDLLIKPRKKNTLEDYLCDLNNLMLEAGIKYRSRTLVSEIIRILKDYILTSDFAPKKPIELGPFSVFGYKGQKMIICSN